jgi:hypothetical protein
MKTKLSLILLTALVCTPVLAAEKKKAASSIPENQAKMMEMWMKLNAKGEQHAEFQESVGTWGAVEKHFMGETSFEGKGSCKIRTILDGRYLIQEYQSESPMGKYEGFGITAYDNMKKQYVMVWLDSMSTGVFTSHGVKKGNTITYRGKQEMPDGTMMHHRMVLKEQGPDKMTFTMHGRTADEKEFKKKMELVYKRVK